MPVDYHAWTHRPKSQGGTDPIDFPSGPVMLRALYAPSGGAAVATATETAILFDTWENEDDTIYGETLSGGDLQKVSLLRPGVYSVTVHTNWETAFASRVENLVLDDSAASTASLLKGNVSGHAPVSEGGSQFDYPFTSTWVRKWPMVGVTEADVVAGAYGRLLVKILQASGSNKDVEAVGLEIFYLGDTLSGIALS